MYEGVNQTRKINNSLMAHVFKRKPQREYLKVQSGTLSDTILSCLRDRLISEINENPNVSSITYTIHRADSKLPK